MKTLIMLVLFSVAAGLWSPVHAQTAQKAEAPEGPPLNQRVEHFELKDGTFMDGLAELSSSPILGLHLGIEEIARKRLSDPRDRSVRFSLSMENRKVEEILDTLCHSDIRYTWSTDGSSINIYPRAAIDDPSNLLNLRLEKIILNDISDPDQALTPLATKLPEEQVGYLQMGGDNAYAKPWTTTFEHLTVRQFTNRIAEHMGSKTSWIWQGGKDARMFTFLRGGFRTDSQ